MQTAFKSYEHFIHTRLKNALSPATTQKVLDNAIRELEFTHYQLGFVTNNNTEYVHIFDNLPQSLQWTLTAEENAIAPIKHAYLSADAPNLFYSEVYKYQRENPTSIAQQNFAEHVHAILEDFGFDEIWTRVYSAPNPVNHSPVTMLFSVAAIDQSIAVFRKLLMRRRGELSVLIRHIFNATVPLLTMQQESVKLRETYAQILTLMGRDSMTQQQTAEALGLTESTVKTYCKLIKRALGKSTLAGAVYEATRLGIVELD